MPIKDLTAKYRKEKWATNKKRISFHLSARWCNVSLKMVSPTRRFSLSEFCRILNFH